MRDTWKFQEKMDSPGIMYLIPENIKREKKIIMRGSLITSTSTWEVKRSGKIPQAKGGKK